MTTVTMPKMQIAALRKWQDGQRHVPKAVGVSLDRAAILIIGGYLYDCRITPAGRAALAELDGVQP